LRGWEKTERESLTLILLVDMSRSTKRYVQAFAIILRSLAGHFQRNRDRMGLVAIQGRQATVVHHPTHNYRIVTRHLTRLAFRGETPLADGLRKALVVARLERFKNPGSQSLVVLLSDCCPEPLKPGPDAFEQPSYREAQAAARLFRKERIHLLILLPSPERPQQSDLRSPRLGERLGESVAALAGGRLIRLTGGESRPMKKETERILGTIDAIFADGFRLGGERGPSGSSPVGSLMER
jgi:Mg-chelatase subunit ChlD